MSNTKDDSGRPYPLGATVCPDGTNFSIFSASACGVQLVLFDHADDRAAAHTVTLDPERNRTSHYRHVFLHGIKAGQLYGYRVDGPSDLQQVSVSILRKSCSTLTAKEFRSDPVTAVPRPVIPETMLRPH